VFVQGNTKDNLRINQTALSCYQNPYFSKARFFRSGKVTFCRFSAFKGRLDKDCLAFDGNRLAFYLFMICIGRR
jgi:hypothetical protein